MAKEQPKMINYKLKKGPLRTHLYYGTNDDTLHFVADCKDKDYIKYRKTRPKQVIFLDTVKQLVEFVQKEIQEGRV